MIEVEGLVHQVGRPARTLLDVPRLSLAPGRMIALSGPSGSGKTTLLSVLGGLVRPTAGSVSYDDEPVWRGSGDPAPAMSFVLQVYGLVPVLSARENVSIALRARGTRAREADAAAAAMLDRLGIGDLGSRQVEELSGGQLQRVACARALVVEAPVLLADEPTSELDRATREVVMGLLRVRADHGALVVVATHDPDIAAVCDEHHHMVEGHLVD